MIKEKCITIWIIFHITFNTVLSVLSVQYFQYLTIQYKEQLNWFRTIVVPWLTCTMILQTFQRICCKMYCIVRYYKITILIRTRIIRSGLKHETAWTEALCIARRMSFWGARKTAKRVTPGSQALRRWCKECLNIGAVKVGTKSQWSKNSTSCKNLASNLARDCILLPF